MPSASGDEVLPEHAIFRFELIGEFPQQLFYPAEDLGRQTGRLLRGDERPLRWPSIALTVARPNAEMIERTADHIRAAQANGEIRAEFDATAEAAAITGAMRGIMGQWLIAPKASTSLRRFQFSTGR
jgi:hypothetical protein